MKITWDLGKDITYEVLIENLGGYERAQFHLRNLGNEHERILLQYRRKHGIFEKDDLIVCLYGQDSTFLTKDEIYTVKEVCYGGSHITLKSQENYDGGDSSYSVNRFNHATDAEIEANKRLEVGL